MAADWYKREPAKALRGVQGMPFEVIGCYFVILDLIYLYGGSIANDPRWIAGQGKASTKSVQAWIRQLIEAGRLIEIDGRLHDEKALTTLRERADRTSTAQKSGALGGRQKALNSAAAQENNDLGLANATPREREKRDTEKEPSGSSSVGAAAPKKRAVRCPDAWQPKPLPADIVANLALMPPGFEERELSRMRDWSQASPNGAKLDWDATWRNWIGRAIDNERRQGNRASGRPASGAGGFARLVAASMGS